MSKSRVGLTCLLALVRDHMEHRGEGISLCLRAQQLDGYVLHVNKHLLHLKQYTYGAVTTSASVVL